jgi:hypothetical protein
MTDTNFPLADDQADDLPRTLRRQREELEGRARSSSGFGAPEPTMPVGDHASDGGVTVTRIEVPFFRLVAFFLKAALAAIPAILLLMVVLWGVGHVLQVYFPHLLKMQILVWFPNTP